MLHCAGFISADSLYMFQVSGAHHQKFLNTPDDGRLTPETFRVSAEIKSAQCSIKLVFYLTYTMMRGNTKVKYFGIQVCGVRSS